MFAAIVAACQPLPHPFADDTPPAALLGIRDSAGVSIASVVGKPDAIADKLGAAVAKALLQRDIPASDSTTSLGSYLLYGRVAEAHPNGGKPTIIALWRLYDANGRTIGEASANIPAEQAAPEKAGDPVEQLAAASADRLAPLLEDDMPAQASNTAAGGGRTRIAIDKISGATGDGAEALAAAIALVLQRQDVTVIHGETQPDLRLQAEIAVTPLKAGLQHVKIVWRVKRADGAEIGTVAQENDVPKGMLEGPWGDLAYSIAIAASDGIGQLIARSAPPRQS